MTGHVAALAVGEDEQAARAGVGAHGLEREPAGEAEALEARELGLDGDAGRAGGVDDRDAVGEHGGGGLEPRGAGRRRARSRAGGRARAGGVRDGRARRLALRSAGGGRPQPRGSGSSPRTTCDSRARDRGGEPVAERRGGRRFAGDRQSVARRPPTS